MYEKRFYRDWSGNEELSRLELKMAESDLLILSDGKVDETAGQALALARKKIERHIELHPEFATALEPLDLGEDAPDIVRAMTEAARAWNVGPMAAVAGAVAQAVGEAICEECECSTVIVENGGDIYARAARKLRFALYAGEESPFAGRLGFELDATRGVGVCTSSGRVGPSLSFGKADAVVAIHTDVRVADAAATAIANRIESPGDVAHVVESEKAAGNLEGLIACCGDRLGLWGDFELIRR